jgi:hypothetical protein
MTILRRNLIVVISLALLAKVAVKVEGLTPPKDSDAKLSVRELIAW